jgi:molybdate transport system substrate-binding protein
MRIRLAALVVAFVVSGADAQVSDVRVMSSGATAPAYLQLIPSFESATKLKAVTLATSNGVGAANIATRLRGGEAVDVLFLSAEIMDQMIKEGHVVAASRADIGRSAIGVGVLAGAKRPDVSTVEALKQTFLDARSIAISAQISGVYLTTELFPALGIAAQVMPKVRRVENEPVGNALVRGEAELGVQQISELRGVKGVDYVGPLPDAVQRVSVFSVGIATKAPNPSGAKAFVELVLSPAGQAVLKQSGLEPILR